VSGILVLTPFLCALVLRPSGGAFGWHAAAALDEVARYEVLIGDLGRKVEKHTSPFLQMRLGSGK
jgi:hypothetical protein